MFVYIPNFFIIDIKLYFFTVTKTIVFFLVLEIVCIFA